jgi:hypothetical protein
MAIQDHTAHACPSVHTEPESDIISDTNDPLFLQSETRQAQETFATRLSSVMLGVVAIQSLQDRWLSEQRAIAYGEPLPRPKPLTVQQISGLNTALRFLCEHRDRIRAELIG